MLQYAVTEFDDKSVETLPTIWLDEVDGELVAYWPDKMSTAKSNKAIEECEARDNSVFMKMSEFCILTVSICINHYVKQIKI